MLLEETTQNVVQQLAGVDGLQIERRFAARLDTQDAITEKSEGAVSVRAQPAGTVNMIRSEMIGEHLPQIIIRNFTVVSAEPVAVPRMFNPDSFARGSRDMTFAFSHR